MDVENHIRSNLDDDNPAFGVQVATISKSMIEVMGDLGIDFVWLDLEHKGPSPYDSDTVEDLVRAAERSGTTLLVRLPGGDPHMIRKVIDTGVRNLIVPQVETAEEVRRAVRAARFEYDGGPGDRGASFARSNRWGAETNDFVSREDDSVCLGVMIETVTALENIDEILSVPELAFVRIGPGDLSAALGHGIDKSHPEVTERTEYLEEKALEYGVPMGGAFSDAEEVEDAVDRGYRLITIGRDISVVRSVIGDRYEAMMDIA